VFWKGMAGRRVTPVALVALLIAIAASPPAAVPYNAPKPVSASAPDAETASVRLTRCSRSDARGTRRAVFRASMDAMPGTARMSMRFVLQEQVGSAPRRKIDAPALAGWRHSRPGVARFTYRQRVLPLEAGVIYRMVVRFRWYDADGAIVASSRRRSPRCNQGRALPNLSVAEKVVVTAGPSPSTSRYRVTVVNRGRANVSGAEVALLVDGAEVDRQPLGSLAPGQRRKVWFVGPECATNIEARADPGGLVRESSEQDNARLTACPSGP
jgi:hypothetical protein